MVDKQEIESAKRVSLIDLVDNGENQVTRARDHVKICCPFHEERTPSCAIYEDHFYCYSCGEKGDTIAYVMKLYSVTFTEAVNALLGRVAT